MTTDRLPPWSEYAENGVIGCCLLDGHRSIEAIEERFKSVVSMFYDLRNADIYRVLLEMWRDRMPIDAITVLQALADKGVLEAVGGQARLLAMEMSVPSPANLPEYVEILRAKALLRATLHACATGSVAAYEYDGREPESVLDALEREITAIRITDSKGRGISDTKELLLSLIDDYEKSHAQTSVAGIQTGFIDLDKIIGGLMPQQIIFLAGTPSAGKTSISLNICAHWVGQGGKVGIFSLETSAKKILHRVICREFQVDGSRLVNGTATEEDFTKLINGMAALQAKRLSWMICDQGGMTVNQITSYARQMHSKGARLFVIDYLQLITSPEKTPTEKVTAISIGLKNLAKELDCPVIAISSLSLDVVKTGRAPTIGDLRQSGQLGYDADMVWLLHCAEPNSEIRQVKLNIAKSKDTDTGDIDLTFIRSFYRFENCSHYQPPLEERRHYAD